MSAPASYRRFYWTRDILQQLTGHPIGGGVGYDGFLRRGSRSDWRVVSNTSQWRSALNSNDRHIWIADGASIDISGQSYRIHNKVIAGNRGINGSPGPLVYSRDRGRNSPADGAGGFRGQCLATGNTRITGIRYRGWAHNNYPNSEHPGYLPFAPGSTSQRAAWRNARKANGVQVRGHNVRIDNCELYGWATQAIWNGARGYPANTEIDHNYIHDNMMTSFGYALTSYYGYPHIHHNFLNAHRHDINGFGPPQSRYRVENNVFGPECSSHRVDMHAARNNGLSGMPGWTAGGSCIVRNNTFTNIHVSNESIVNQDRGQPTWLYSNRGVPASGSSVIIERNRILHNGPQTRNYGTGGSVRAGRPSVVPFIQNTSGFSTNSQGFVRVTHRNNSYYRDRGSYDPSIGAPINLDGPTPTATGPLTVFVEDAETGERIRNASVKIDQID